MVIHRRKLNKSLVWFSVLFSVSLVIAPFGARAAILYLEPSSGDYHQGDVFFVEVRLDTQGEIINAVEVNLSFDNSVLEFKDFSKGNSILTLWTEEPKFSEIESQTVISFSGGVPGGYWGNNGLLGKIIFQAGNVDVKRLQTIEILDSSRVLLNNGLGTEANLSFKEARFNILTQEGGERNFWQEEIEADKILPESFKIELSQDPAIFDGKYFIVFSTVDKQTGIDRYEVKEGSGNWEEAISPYVLKNQKLTSDIKVKAIDKAGNFWMETMKARNKQERKWEIVILGLIVILAVIGIWRIVRKIKRKLLNNVKGT